jgi:hypothetical protein
VRGNKPLGLNRKIAGPDDGIDQESIFLKRVAAGEQLREIALSYAVDHPTISRLEARHAPR